ncbi:MAG: DUF748 domain-containing protein [Burkholderiaceae bacterium]|nr:DUF748 domain-containing protein [Burkholderiaceae bacterium]
MKRRLAIAAVVLVALAAIVAGGLQVATRALRAQVLAALGPESEVGAITLGLGRVQIDSLRVPAPSGWPAPDALRARSVVVTPDMRSLFSPTVRVSTVSIEQAYLSVVRTAEGKVRVLPGLQRAADEASSKGAASGAASGKGDAGKGDAGKGTAPTARIAKVELRETALEFFDQNVRRPALRIRADELSIDVEDLVIPALDARSRLRIAGTVRGAPGAGASRDGTVAVNGWIVFANRNSELRTQLRGVDLAALQPYLIRTTEAGVRRGLLDLDLDSTIRAGRVDAPGVLTLTGLELATTGSGAQTFMGLPRQAVLALMKDGRDRITVNFSLHGSLDDPRFSISEDLAVRVAAALAKELGVSFEGVVRGLGGAGGRSAEAAGEAAKALGSALRGLFGR